jgi:hypothetical protein
VIEMCGSGFDSFDNWMHELLIECSHSISDPSDGRRRGGPHQMRWTL